jgi:predicted peptidase
MRRRVRWADGNPYRILRPAELAGGRTHPLVVLFHGSGAIGTDNISQVGPLAKSWASPLLHDAIRRSS